MFGSIPDWDMFLRECWDFLRPGGYIEIVEHSVTPVSDDDGGLGQPYRLWEQTIAEAEQRSGRSFSIWCESAQLLESCGFQDVVRMTYRWPINRYVYGYNVDCQFLFNLGS
jgi:hypothetical protein